MAGHVSVRSGGWAQIPGKGRPQWSATMDDRRLRSSLDAGPEGLALNRPKRLVGRQRPRVHRSPFMTLPRSDPDVLACHVTLEVECIDRMYLNFYVPKLQFVEAWCRSCAPTRPAVRLLGAAGADQPGLHRRPVPLRQRPGGGHRRLHQGATQGRPGAGVPGRVRQRRGSAVHGTGSGKGAGLPHREAQETHHRGHVPVDRADHGHGQPLLHLLPSAPTSARSSKKAPAAPSRNGHLSRYQPPPAGGSAVPESPMSAGTFCGSSSSNATTSTSISAAASVAYSGSSSANLTSSFPVISRTYQHARSASPPRRKHPRTSQHDTETGRHRSR